MTYAAARRAFSTIIDVARSRMAIMDHLGSRNDPDTVSIWGADEGDLHLRSVGSRDRLDYELEWELGTMPRALRPGESALDSSRRSLSALTTAQMIETSLASESPLAVATISDRALALDPFRGQRPLFGRSHR